MKALFVPFARIAAILRRRLATTLGWTRSSYFLMSAFTATLLVIGVVWWPLAMDVPQPLPPFAVLAHGMAAVAFWRVTLLLRQLRIRLLVRTSAR
jgi:hypothetical protein